MYLFKLKKNNRGYSTINWVVLICTTIFMLCLMLDMVNLVVVKNVLIDRVAYLANVGTVQGGFVSGPPLGWDYIHPNSYYLDANEARISFESAFDKYRDFVSNVRVDGLSKVDVHQDGCIEGSLVYHPCFTKKFSTPDVPLRHSAKFCGFWWYENTWV